MALLQAHSLGWCPHLTHSQQQQQQHSGQQCQAAVPLQELADALLPLLLLSQVNRAAAHQLLQAPPAVLLHPSVPLLLAGAHVALGQTQWSAAQRPQQCQQGPPLLHLTASPPLQP